MCKGATCEINIVIKIIKNPQFASTYEMLPFFSEIEQWRAMTKACSSPRG